jgi:hypothetical protein
MGLDIYVGPLTRYYVGDWETVVQRYGREQAIPITVVRPKGQDEETEPRLSATEVLEVVTEWRSRLGESLGSNLHEPLNWSESADGEYFTDKPAWDGYANLVLLAAYDDNPHLLPPRTAVTEFGDDPAWKASTKEGFRSKYTTILHPELWLPGRFAFVFQAPDVAGKNVWIGSNVTLLEQLRALNESTVRGNGEQHSQWRRENFDRGDTFKKASQFGLAMFIELAEKSVLMGLPMKMDY